MLTVQLKLVKKKKYIYFLYLYYKKYNIFFKNKDSGSIYLFDVSEVVINDSKFINNKSLNRGGVILMMYYGIYLDIENSTLQINNS